MAEHIRIGRHSVDPVILEKSFASGCGPFACESTCCSAGVYVDLAERTNILAQKEIIVTRERGSRDIRPCIQTIEVNDRTLLITLEDKDQIKPRIQDVVSRCFDLAPEEAVQVKIRRTGMYYRLQGEWVSPLVV